MRAWRTFALYLLLLSTILLLTDSRHAIGRIKNFFFFGPQPGTALNVARKHLKEAAPSASDYASATDEVVNTSSCSRSRHFVIASFGKPRPYHAVSLAFAARFHETTVHHLWLHNGADMNGTSDGDLSRKHMLTLEAGSLGLGHFSDSSSIEWRALYEALGVQADFIDLSSLDTYSRLRRSYIHSSVNDYEMELFCFARFIGLHAFCTDRGIDQLTWVDADIPIFDADGFLDRVCLPAGHEIWALTNYSSFLNTMTCSAIGRFVDRMLLFFSRANRNAFVRTVDEFGSADMDSRPDVKQRLREEEPSFDELGIAPKHFSDMMLFSLFLRETNAAASSVDYSKDRTVSVADLNTTYNAATFSRGSRSKESGGSVAASGAVTARVPKNDLLHRRKSSRSGQRSRAFVLQEAGNGSIDPYFVPMLGLRTLVTAESEKIRVCSDDAVWASYFSVNQVAARGSGSKRYPVLMYKENNGTWLPMAGAHFQGDCKERLEAIFKL